MQTDTMGKFGPREIPNRQHVMQKLGQFPHRRAYFGDVVGLLDRAQMRTDMMDTTRRRTDDVSPGLGDHPHAFGQPRQRRAYRGAEAPDIDCVLQVINRKPAADIERIKAA